MIGIQATNYWDNVVHPRINPSFEDSCLPIISGEIGDGLLMASPHFKKKNINLNGIQPATVSKDVCGPSMYGPRCLARL